MRMMRNEDEDDEDEDEEDEDEDENEDDDDPLSYQLEISSRGRLGGDQGGSNLGLPESFRVSNSPAPCLFLAKARATSASTASFRDLTLPIICCLHCQPWHDSRECAALTDFVATQLHFAARANGGAPEPISTQCATWQLGRILYPQILNKQNKQI